MKINLKNLSVLLLLLIIVLFSFQCDSPTKSKRKQIVSLNSEQGIWPSNGKDYDHDAFYSSLYLNIDLDVSSGSIDVFVVLGVRFYDPSDTAGYYLYYTSPSFTVDGQTTEDGVAIVIGDPNVELPQWLYDFVIQVYKSSDPNGSPVLEVLPSDPAYGEYLKEIPIEELETDRGFIIHGAYFSEQVDNDEDGYYSDASIIVNADVSTIELDDNASVYLMFSIRLTGASEYTEIAYTQPFTIVGASLDDDVKIYLHDIDYDFSHDLYDFKVELFYENRIIIEDSYDELDNENLGGVALETSEDDPLTMTFAHHDNSFENYIYYNYGNPASEQLYFLAGFNYVPSANVISSSIKRISIRISGNPSYIKLRVLAESPLPPIYMPSNQVYVTTGWNTFYVDIDITDHDRFYVGYIQTVLNAPYLSTDTNWPHSGESWWYSGSDWRTETDKDYAIEAYVESIISSGSVSKISKVINKGQPTKIAKMSNIKNSTTTASN